MKRNNKKKATEVTLALQRLPHLTLIPKSNLRQNEKHYKISKFYTKWRGNRDNLDNRRKGGIVPQIETKIPQMRQHLTIYLLEYMIVLWRCRFHVKT